VALAMASGSLVLLVPIEHRGRAVRPKHARILRAREGLSAYVNV
jgi:hypothetical protein